MASCGGTLVKTVLAVFNFIGLAIGGFIIYLGIRIFQFNSTEHLQDVIKANLATGALVVTLFGSAIALIALTGFLGACCESTLLLNVYGFVVLALLVLQCVGVYFNYKVQHEYYDQFGTGISSAINSAFNNAVPDPKLAYALQNIQLNLKCCGWTGPNDYNRDQDLVPISCCGQKVSVAEPMKMCARSAMEYTVGCKDSPVVNFVKGSINWSSYAMILIELILILAACCLARDLARYQPVNTFG